MDRTNRGRVITGFLLIALGLGLWGLNLSDDVGRRTVLLALGGLFIAGYLYSRAYLQLVAGGVLFGLGLGMLGEQYRFFWGEYSRLGLGAGFILIFVIAFLYERRSHWWPLIPGTILILLGLGRWNRAWTYMFGEGWPLLLVVGGVLVLLGALGRPRPKKKRT
jgi:hypothetical protein